MAQRAKTGSQKKASQRPGGQTGRGKSSRGTQQQQSVRTEHQGLNGGKRGTSSKGRTPGGMTDFDA